ncbi:MAG: VOC family protein [Acidobacteriota bacterium]|nr:VOC family protein [Acidobacteriota bacterium]
MTFNIDRLDHLVLTVLDIRQTCDFYTRVLGLTEITYDDERKALRFGNQKINLHEYGNEYEPHAFRTVPGSADLCFKTDAEIEEIQQHLADCSVEIIDGPLKRTGAVGTITSIYIRDPDLNLIEIAHYD